jgi:OOP family OmpA-OmpF porin
MKHICLSISIALIGIPSFSQIDSARFDTGSSFIMRNLTFDIGKATLPHGDAAAVNVALEELDKLASVMKERQTIEIEVIGHTDNKGSAIGGVVRNMRLSLERARVVKRYLISKGISRTRIAAIGRGGSEPIAPGNNWRNRRIEIHVIKE